MPVVRLDDSEDIVEGAMPTISPDAPISRATTVEHALSRFGFLSIFTSHAHTPRQRHARRPRRTIRYTTIHHFLDHFPTHLFYL